MRFAVFCLVASCLLAAVCAVHVDTAAARRHMRSQLLDSRVDMSAAMDSSVDSLAVATARSQLSLSFDSMLAEIKSISSTFKSKVVSLFPTSLCADIRTHVSGFISKIENAAVSMGKFISNVWSSLTSIFSCPLPARMVEVNTVASIKLGFGPLVEPLYCSYKATVNALSNLFPSISTWDKNFLLGRVETLPSLYKPAAFVETSAEAHATALVAAHAGNLAAVRADRLDCNAVGAAVAVFEGVVAWCDDLLNAIDNAVNASDTPQVVISFLAGVAQLIVASLKAVCTEDQNSSGDNKWTQR